VQNRRFDVKSSGLGIGSRCDANAGALCWHPTIATQPVPLGLAAGLIPSLSDFIGSSLTSVVERVLGGTAGLVPDSVCASQLGVQRCHYLAALADSGGRLNSPGPHVAGVYAVTTDAFMCRAVQP
jgi:hypothetical protein